jgi:hypothetical protein
MFNLYEGCMLRYRYQIDYAKEVVFDLLRVCLLVEAKLVTS